ncbi:MAG: hypothetical protein ABIZ91_17420 [Gemmatimonadaceae bacterium]
MLPPLYARWVDELLQQPLPLETLSPCNDCVMCKPPSEVPRPAARGQFNPITKCCTYMPTIPNFLIGAVLVDEDPAAAEGRLTLEKRLDAGVAISPRWAAMTPVFRLLYQHGERKAFGRATSMRCPHYLDREGGQCGIWRHRNSVCSTYFCNLERGLVGQRFWEEMKSFLEAIELSLSEWCVRELDIGADALARLDSPAHDEGFAHLTAHEIDGVADAHEQRAIWGSWAGREREFYIAAGRMVESLTWKEVLRIGGEDIANHAQLLGVAYAALMNDDVPDLLTFAPVRSEPVDDYVSRVWATGLDLAPIEIPTPLVSALRHFDGRTPTQDAIFSVVFETRMGLQKWLVARLMDAGILVSPAPE